MPGFFDVSLLDKIPQERNVFEEVKERFHKRKTQASKLFRLPTLLNTKVSWYNFDDLKKIFVRLPGGVPKISERDQWMDDVVFGSQFLNGCNPNFIKRCEVLPKNFPVTEEMVKDFLDRGKSLDREMKVYSEFLKPKANVKQFLQVNAPQRSCQRGSFTHKRQTKILITLKNNHLKVNRLTQVTKRR